ncbi:hypothetical protein Gorai_012387 [Gossypium raimondii]|uniref:Anaphase-promoting complex subunit 4 WD40 domain-containing protein n=1 Tax=Gossypium raimondii TaxID=29730 RepID=A0A7J8Q1U9_GOSRA|nr:hypothetical protein [Gossypium raimondii]
MNVVIAPSSIDIGIDCRGRQTGSRANPLQGLLLYSPRPRLRSSSTLRLNSFSSPQPQAKVKSFPAEAVKPLAANSEGRYIVAGGSSGDVYLWEVVTGKLSKKWHAHFEAVTCLVFSEDDSLLISRSEDGCVRVWSLSRGRLLRNIMFPSIIDAIALDPGEHVLYAGFQDGKIYIAALNAESSPSNSYGLHIIGSLSDHRSYFVFCFCFSYLY